MVPMVSALERLHCINSAAEITIKNLLYQTSWNIKQNLVISFLRVIFTLLLGNLYLSRSGILLIFISFISSFVKNRFKFMSNMSKVSIFICLYFSLHKTNSSCQGEFRRGFYKNMILDLAL